MTDGDTTPSPTPAPKVGGRPNILKNGRSRNPYADPNLWNEVPSPKSPFVRDALAAYLLDPEPDLARPRDGSGRYRTGETTPPTQVGVYIEDAQWAALGALPGTRTAHFNAALRRALADR